MIVGGGDRFSGKYYLYVFTQVIEKFLKRLECGEKEISHLQFGDNTFFLIS